MTTPLRGIFAHWICMKEMTFTDVSKQNMADIPKQMRTAGTPITFSATLWRWVYMNSTRNESWDSRTFALGSNHSCHWPQTHYFCWKDSTSRRGMICVGRTNMVIQQENHWMISSIGWVQTSTEENHWCTDLYNMCNTVHIRSYNVETPLVSALHDVCINSLPW